MNHDEIMKRLHAPFPARDVEWKIQVTTHDKQRGMAVAYLDARSVQRRLDETLGAFNWKNVYSLWHDNSQICGISIFNEARNEWVTKYDGAECSEIEPIKGGLSDSFKRAASVWGVGRYLYELDAIWVEIEPRGKSFTIKQSQYAKLEAEYNAAVKKIFGTAATSPDKPAPDPTHTADEYPPEGYAHDFKVQSIKPSGKSSQVLELVDGEGNMTKAYIKAFDRSITAGTRLLNVQMVRKNSEFGEYNLINNYELAA